ncbi:TPA: adenylate/guanylate cyclase domain-containing protein [Vibrio diabolicus]|uniref:adenylate/guanylate cyclase domain-containing protein n=1 Tax=Vibrio harveyi group TaxID=717610 RepID=UPI00215C616B|nr:MULTISPECIES: adenylate/guanylate cyclase domain-containing protein [Vibrio harveyi group]MCR9303148.1 adenylate/guanylate cyclase domain-containing protein [Vibrio diabolicus]MCR9426277.1 adenylate/guanylate cyclase domain-containing protein [Vibrio diabolicus]MCS0284250.1 adenylate/guanylate cyclase domain-containing protein [Vibrio alginolyticus]MCS0393295.1 adenylate/guanylate cyclase domain-containing protein [Vibrio diabolicus]
MNFENLFDDFYKKTNARSEIKKSRLEEQSFLESNQGLEHYHQDSNALILQGPQEEFLLQQQIRKIYGKDGINSTPIGTHPDFLHLEYSDQLVHQYSCTMFVDIKGSTRLSLLYDLKDVFAFKNTVIQTCVEVVRAFDGSVHRLMGDAVMSFFGRNNKSKEDAIADAINCAATLRVMLEKGIKPWMSANNFDDKDFGFRLGLDFGDDDEVLWGNFGYSTVGEVSATGLPVDMASKLQGLAGKNNTMLGQGLLDFIEWPEYYSDTHTNIKMKDGVQVYTPVPFVKPNITDADGNPINYRMKKLMFKNFMEVSALPPEVKTEINPNVRTNPDIEFKCFVVDNNRVREEYISASRYLDKELNLEFEVQASTRGRLAFPLRVIFTKTNYGKHVPEDEREIATASEEKWLHVKFQSSFNKTPLPYAIVTHQEGTSYRGLHTMKCQVKDRNDNIVFTNWIGVMIK